MGMRVSHMMSIGILLITLLLCVLSSITSVNLICLDAQLYTLEGDTRIIHGKVGSPFTMKTVLPDVYKVRHTNCAIDIKILVH